MCWEDHFEVKTVAEKQGICSTQCTSHRGLEVEWWWHSATTSVYFQASVVPFKYFNCVLLKYHFYDSAIGGNKML